MDIFFGKMGITDLKYKCAYNPCEYMQSEKWITSLDINRLSSTDTEPSMEIFSYRMFQSHLSPSQSVNFLIHHRQGPRKASRNRQQWHVPCRNVGIHGPTVRVTQKPPYSENLNKLTACSKDMRVFGWGLSLERPTMIKYGISNIRELLGHKVDLSFMRNNPAVRLDKA